jgi:hypothetical protein
VTNGLEAGDRVIVGNVGAIGRGVKVRIAGGRGDPSTSSGSGREGGRSGRRGGARPDSSAMLDSSASNGLKK